MLSRETFGLKANEPLQFIHPCLDRQCGDLLRHSLQILSKVWSRSRQPILSDHVFSFWYCVACYCLLGWNVIESKFKTLVLAEGGCCLVRLLGSSLVDYASHAKGQRFNNSVACQNTYEVSKLRQESLVHKEFLPIL